MRFEPQSEESQYQHTHEQVKQYSYVDKHRHLIADSERKQKNGILNDTETNEGRYDQLVCHNEQESGKQGEQCNCQVNGINERVDKDHCQHNTDQQPEY